MHELSGHPVVPMEDVLGREARDLVERLVECPGWEARFAKLDAYIAGRVREAARPAPCASRSTRRTVARRA